jgi:hypothetical protein
LAGKNQILRFLVGKFFKIQTVWWKSSQIQSFWRENVKTVLFGVKRSQKSSTKPQSKSVNLTSHQPDPLQFPHPLHPLSRCWIIKHNDLFLEQSSNISCRVESIKEN